MVTRSPSAPTDASTPHPTPSASSAGDHVTQVARDRSARPSGDARSREGLRRDAGPQRGARCSWTSVARRRHRPARPWRTPSRSSSSRTARPTTTRIARPTSPPRHDEVRRPPSRRADYGAALRAGLLEAATGDVVVNFDVDYYDLDFLAIVARPWSARRRAPAIVVGSKRAPGAHDHRARPRRFVTWGFGTLLRLGFGLRCSDTHGMKAMRPGPHPRPGAGMPLRRRPLRHRARDPRRARRPRRRGDPRHRRRAATVPHPDRPTHAAIAGRARTAACRALARASVAMTDVLATEALCAPCAPEPGWVAFEDGVITEVGQGRPPAGARILDDAVLAPGFIDLQCNGVGPDDLARTDRAAVGRASAQRSHVAGVTAYCPTLVSAPLDHYAAPLREIAARRTGRPVRRGRRSSACTSRARSSAPRPAPIRPDLLRTVDPETLHGLLDAATDAVRIMTIAPEADPDQRAIRTLVAAGHRRRARSLPLLLRRSSDRRGRGRDRS